MTPPISKPITVGIFSGLLFIGISFDTAAAAPVAVDDSATTYVNTAVNIAVLANDSGDWVAGSFTQGSNGTVTFSGNGTLTYIPDTDFVGTDSFTYTVTDISGISDSATITVTVAAGSVPVAVDDCTTTSVNTAVNIAVLANDSGDWVAGSFTQPSNGAVTGAGDGTLTHTPNTDFVGMDSFTYTVRDSSGIEVTAMVTVTVAAARPPAFTDVTFLAGINHVQHSLANPTVGFGEPGAMSGGAAAGDYDGDGFIDLYVTRLDAPDILYRNRGDGTFENVTATSGINRGSGSNGAGWQDIDNDGDLDLYVTSLADTRFYLYVNDGLGNFTEEGLERGAAIDGPDLHYGYSVTFGDYDDDGYLDIHTCEWRRDAQENPTGAPSNSRLLRNLGTMSPGHFEDVTQIAGVALDTVVGGANDGTFSFSSRFSDLDGDGHLDLVIASDFSESRLFWNNGDGTFTDGTDASGVGGVKVITDENGMGSAIGDYDGDGFLDWFVTSIFDPNSTCEIEPCMWGYTGNRLYHNNGDRTFTDATDAAGVRDGGWGWGTTFIDYDNDGDLDLVMTNGIRFPGTSGEDAYNNDAMRFWENDGAGNFTEVAAALGVTDTGSGKGLLKFDYDNDGDLDLLVVNTGARPILYRNDVNNGNGWLRIKIIGNESGIGAKITLTAEAGGPSQIREINAGSNFLSQDEVTAHFGLGQGTAPVDKVEIKWPDGTVLVLTDLPRNQVISVAKP
jgi:hypothetical protein